jgi:nucleotide-binding universal stress UspA family protein
MNMFSDAPIIAPVDFSEKSDRGVDVALEIATLPQQVIVVHVAPLLSAFDLGVVVVVSDAERREKILQAAHKRYANTKYRSARFEVRFGDPGREIAAIAKELSAGLIVMPSHGRTGLAHILLGSVAERVVRLAHCPILVLRS